MGNASTSGTPAVGSVVGDANPGSMTVEGAEAGVGGENVGNNCGMNTKLVESGEYVLIKQKKKKGGGAQECC